ncbi:hypothetical protein STEG23_003444 [Scotinomys teguina]
MIKGFFASSNILKSDEETKEGNFFFSALFSIISKTNRGLDISRATMDIMLLLSSFQYKKDIMYFWFKKVTDIPHDNSDFIDCFHILMRFKKSIDHGAGERLST